MKALNEFEAPAWMGRGFHTELGVLTLNQGRLRFVVEDRVVFDAPVPELNLTWPWYGFGCQFWAHAQGQKYFVSALHPNNTIITWWKGIRRGRGWKRAIDALSRQA